MTALNLFKKLLLIDSWTLVDKLIITYKQDKVFHSELSKFCGRQHLKNLEGYGLLEHALKETLKSEIKSAKCPNSHSNFLEKTKKANKNLKTLRICVMKLQNDL